PTTHHPLSLHDALPICQRPRFRFSDSCRHNNSRISNVNGRLSRQVSPIHQQRASGHERRFVGGEKEDRVGDLLRLSIAPNWFPRSEEHTSELQSPCNLV